MKPSNNSFLSSCLANSKGQTVYSHLHGVAMRTLAYADEYLPESGLSLGSTTDRRDVLRNSAFLSGLWHDVGKCLLHKDYLQKLAGSRKKIKKSTPAGEDEEDFAYGSESALDESQPIPFHHELSWLMMSLVSSFFELKLTSGPLKDVMSTAGWSVFYHHRRKPWYVMMKNNKGSPYFETAGAILASLDAASTRNKVDYRREMALGMFECMEMTRDLAVQHKLCFLAELATKFFNQFPTVSTLVEKCSLENLDAFDVKDSVPEYHDADLVGSLRIKLASVTKPKERRAAIEEPILLKSPFGFTEYLAVRACLVTADWEVSAMSKKDLDDWLFGVRLIALGPNACPLLSELPRTEQWSLSAENTTVKDERWIEQDRIAEEASNAQTYICNLYAGGGKTRTALQAAMRSGAKRIIWVTPRNSIATGVFRQLPREFEALGYESPPMQLVQRSEVVEFTGCTRPELFESQVVVTNLDNLLSPLVKHGLTPWTLWHLDAYVVFDEYHEFPGQSALYAGFIYLMRMRHVYSKAKSLLLSATPLPLAKLWDSSSKKSVQRGPQDRAKHFNSKSHKLVFHNGLCNQPTTRGVTMYNSVSNAQLAWLRGDERLAHGSYNDKEKKIVVDGLLSSYGLRIATSEDSYRPTLASAVICRAALDVSFPEMRISLCEPWNFIQILGRLDRWKTEINTRITVCDAISVTKEEGLDKAELSAIVKTSDALELAKEWGSFLRQRYIQNEDSKTKKVVQESLFCLQEMYDAYGDFLVRYKADFDRWIQGTFHRAAMDFSRMTLIGASRRSRHASDQAIKTASENMRSGSSLLATTEVFRIHRYAGTACAEAANRLLTPEETISVDRSMVAPFVDLSQTREFDSDMAPELNTKGFSFSVGGKKTARAKRRKPGRNSDAPLVLGLPKKWSQLSKKFEVLLNSVRQADGPKSAPPRRYAYGIISDDPIGFEQVGLGLFGERVRCALESEDDINSGDKAEPDADETVDVNSLDDTEPPTND